MYSSLVQFLPFHHPAKSSRFAEMNKNAISDADFRLFANVTFWRPTSYTNRAIINQKLIKLVDDEIGNDICRIFHMRDDDFHPVFGHGRDDVNAMLRGDVNNPVDFVYRKQGSAFRMKNILGHVHVHTII